MTGSWKNNKDCLLFRQRRARTTRLATRCGLLYPHHLSAKFHTACSIFPSRFCQNSKIRWKGAPKTAFGKVLPRKLSTVLAETRERCPHDDCLGKGAPKNTVHIPGRYKGQVPPRRLCQERCPPEGCLGKGAPKKTVNGIGRDKGKGPPRRLSTVLAETRERCPQEDCLGRSAPKKTVYSLGRDKREQHQPGS
jgi:hypothetical protein